MQRILRSPWLLALLMLVVLSSAAAAQESVEPAVLVANAVVLDPPDLGAGVRLGGFSGLVALDPAQGIFLTVTDRGPDSVDHGRLLAPAMTYQPSIVKLKLQDTVCRSSSTLRSPGLQPWPRSTTPARSGGRGGTTWIRRDWPGSS